MNYFKLYADVKITKGWNRSIISDLLYNDFYFIPNQLADVLLSSSILHMNKLEDWPKYKSLLIEKKLIYVDDRAVLEKFSELSLTREKPRIIDHIIIEGINRKNLEKQFAVASTLNVQRLLLSSNEVLTEELFITCIDLAQKYSISNISFFVRALQEAEVASIVKLLESINRIDSIYVQSEEVRAKSAKLFFNKKLPSFSNPLQDVNYDLRKMFCINTQFYQESIHGNPMLDARLAFTTEGDIRLSYSAKAIGNITSFSIKELKTELNKSTAWNVPKSKVDVCSNCEFRFICPDERLPTLRENGSAFHPSLECKYNPYISKWEDEEGFMSLDQSGVKVGSDKTEILEEELTLNFSKVWS